MVSQEEIKETAHKITIEQLAEAEKIKESYKSKNPDKNSPFKTMGEMYAHNYLRVISNPSHTVDTPKRVYKHASERGIFCPNCNQQDLRQYSASKSSFYWECKKCNHRFKSPKR